MLSHAPHETVFLSGSQVKNKKCLGTNLSMKNYSMREKVLEVIESGNIFLLSFNLIIDDHAIITFSLTRFRLAIRG